MKKIIILGLGVAAFFMQGCDFLDRTPEDIIETGKFFESANANALEQDFSGVLLLHIFCFR